MCGGKAARGDSSAILLTTCWPCTENRKSQVTVTQTNEAQRGRHAHAGPSDLVIISNAHHLTVVAISSRPFGPYEGTTPIVKFLARRTARSNLISYFCLDEFCQ